MFKKHFRRTRLKMEPHQLRRMALQFLYLFIFFLFFFTVYFVPLARQMGDDSLPFEGKQRVAHQILAFHNRVLPVMSIVIIMFVVNFAVDAHRISGPLYRFRNIFESIADGDLCVRTSIRRKDYLKKEAELLTRMVESLRSRIEEIKSRNSMVEHRYRNLAKAVQEFSAEDIEISLLKLQESLKDMKEAVSRFDTGESAESSIGCNTETAADLNRPEKEHEHGLQEQA